uniref:Beta-defensin n=1 Tax=Vombatus ursinus TaxID=29139 RepID=A0A4X2KEX2_VOMUR
IGYFIFLEAIKWDLAFIKYPLSGAGFLDEKCQKYQGRCVSKCQKNEELAALCSKFQKCCKLMEPSNKCLGSDLNSGPLDSRLSALSTLPHTCP